MNIATSTTDRMKAVKAAWDKASGGPKKDAALKHYQAAEKAQIAKKEPDMISALNKATAALL